MLSTQYFYIKQNYKYWAAKSLANMSSLLKEKLIIDLPIINFIKVSYHYLPASVVTHCLPYCFVRHVLTIFSSKFYQTWNVALE